MLVRRVTTFTVVLLAAGAATRADVTFDVAGLAGTGATAQITFSYSAINATSGTIVIDIENTTPNSVDTNGARITAFGFNVPEGFTLTSIGGDVDDAGSQVATGLTSPNESGWYGRYDPGNIDSPNGAGDFDFGVMNSPKVQAFITDGVGTTSAPRIVQGETTTFTLAVVGAGLSSLTEADFLSAVSTNGTAGAFNFAVRFQGVGRNDESDLATSVPVPIPAPASLALCALGFAGLTLCRSLRRRPA